MSKWYFDDNSQRIEICPVCGAKISPIGDEENEYGKLYKYWACDVCECTGTAIIDTNRGNAFIRHEVD